MLWTAPFFLLTAAAWAGGPLPVVTTTTDLKALVEAVGGERVQVESLASPLQDPHALEVKPGQLAKLKAATLLVRIGLDHEPWLSRALRTLRDPRFARESPHYLDTSKGIQLLQAETPRVRADKGVHLHGFGNTHYWLDPENGRPITFAILQALVRLAPAERLYFEANRNRFLDQLDKRLKVWSQAMAPYKSLRVVAVHETWPYFVQRFGLVIVGVVEPTPGVPPPPSYLASLIQKMRASDIRLLIADPYSNDSVVSQVATQTGATAITLIPSVGGDPEASDYLSLFDLNIKRLSKAPAAR
ncbi:MAG TPA: metal ABC transporter substrate-binding protein [Candidatus Binatia bacterium]|nr:metal ABC transporter substrate-binding protein [Candidatus Binatia bacterium]